MEANSVVKILIVDDKKENLLSLQVVLANQGFKFVEASSGREALRILLKSQDFAIILMDVQMPLMDGFETAELIRLSDKLKQVPIIFLTANMDTTEYIFKGYQAGAVDYMIKPLSPEILKAKVMVFAELYKKNHELELKETQMELLNRKILAANNELAIQIQEKEQQALELRMANKELQSFAYISSHDLQEPLRKIQTFTSILLETENQHFSDKGKYLFGRIKNAAHRMQTLINDLLAYSRTSTDEIVFEKVHLNSILEEIKEEFQDELIEKGAVIRADDLCEATIIPFQFRQLMDNLISNALKFTKPETPTIIDIGCKLFTANAKENPKLIPNQEYCHISVADNGIGFDVAYSEKIFEVFQRLHGKEIYSGTGIGLAIVKKIIDNHNGIIEAYGNPGKGAVFHVYLPL